MQIIDPVLNPTTVELSTLTQGDVCTLAGAHLVVTNALAGGEVSVLRFEDSRILGLPPATLVVPRKPAVVTFPN